jgi:hypothetical protein
VPRLNRKTTRLSEELFSDWYVAKAGHRRNDQFLRNQPASEIEVQRHDSPIGTVRRVRYTSGPKDLQESLIVGLVISRSSPTHKVE